MDVASDMGVVAEMVTAQKYKDLAERTRRETLLGKSLYAMLFPTISGIADKRTWLNDDLLTKETQSYVTAGQEHLLRTRWVNTMIDGEDDDV